METLIKIKCPDKSEYTDAPNDDVWVDDISKKRKSQADALTNLIVAQNYSCTIGLNGGWGSGKTFFLTRFVKEYCTQTVEGAKYKPSAIYFNAWMDDFIQDPLLSILGQITQAKCLKEKFGEKIDDLKKAAKPLLAQVGLGLAKCVGKGILKKVTGVDSEDIKDVFEISLGDIKSFEEQKLLDNYADVCNSRNELHKALEELAKKNWDNTKFPLVVVIDELDRCRPLFAIELLERIKHLFDVPHLVFVIGMDADELKKSLKAVYGDIDTQDYLLKFIDVEATLPPLPKEAFIDSLWHELGYDNLTVSGSRVYEEWDLVLKHFKLLSKINNLTLRQIEQGIRLFAFLACPYKSCTPPVSYGLIATGVMLKVVNPEMYRRVVDWSFDIWDLLDAVLPLDALVDKTSDAYTAAQELYKLVCAHNPMGVIRQNLTSYAVGGKILEGSSEGDFRLPKCVENLSPSDRQVFFASIRDDIRSVNAVGGPINGEYNKQRVQYLEEMRKHTIEVINQAFQIA